MIYMNDYSDICRAALLPALGGMMEDKQTKNSTQKSSTPKNSTWNYHPELPIPLSPIFAWPPKPLAWFKWLSGYWFAISSTTIILALALTAYALYQPEWDAMQTFAPGWIFTIWLRNIILITLVAGSLHLWFITFSKQGRELKFDSRDQVKNSEVFSFSSQVWDNMFWSLASGISAWTIWEVLYFWAAANGYVPRLLSVHDNPAWFIGFFFIIPIWSSFHFYCIHRILHWPPLYRRVHALHHRNINIGPWAGISMHPVETLMYFSSVMLHFVVLSHPAHVIFHLCVEGLNPAFSHSGFEAVMAKDKKRLNAGDFFHQLHHRYIECNYGTAEMPWDKVFGSFHNGSKDAMDKIRARRQKAS